MKRFFRLFCLVLAAALLAISLCSCRYLDEERAAQAFYIDEERTEIEYHDAVYKKINPGKLQPIVFDGSYNYQHHFVTERDVPVLLGSRFGSELYVNKDETILMTGDNYYYTYTESYYDPESAYFVREDKYEDVKKAIETAKLDHYYFSYYEYPEDDDWTMMPEGHDVLLDDETTAAFNKALQLPTNEKISCRELNDELPIITMSRCDKDMILEDETTYYIIQKDFDYYAWDGNAYNEYSIGKITDEDAALFKKLFKTYGDAVGSDNIAWYFDNNYYNYDDWDNWDDVAYGEDDSDLPKTDGINVYL